MIEIACLPDRSVVFCASEIGALVTFAFILAVWDIGFGIVICARKN